MAVGQPDGAVYVTGRTESVAATFPATGGPDGTHNGEAEYALAFMYAMSDQTEGLIHYKRSMELGVKD